VDRFLSSIDEIGSSVGVGGVLADRFLSSIDEIGSSVGVTAFSPIDFSVPSTRSAVLSA
jgi:hypothetical protein